MTLCSVGLEIVVSKGGMLPRCISQCKNNDLLNWRFGLPLASGLLMPLTQQAKQYAIHVLAKGLILVIRRNWTSVPQWR